MIKIDNFPNAYKEVYIILNSMSEEDKSKLPNELLKDIEKNMNQDYNFSLDPNKRLKEQKLLRETKAILGNIFLDYFATNEQKNKIKQVMKKDLIQYENEKKLKYNPDDLFKNQKVDEIILDNIDENKHNSLIERKESFLVKIINKIKLIFRR